VLVGELKALLSVGAAVLVKRLWPHSMELLEISRAEASELIETYVASIVKRPSRWLGQINRQIACLLIVRLTLHRDFSSVVASTAGARFSTLMMLSKVRNMIARALMIRPAQIVVFAAGTICVAASIAFLTFMVGVGLPDGFAWSVRPDSAADTR